MSLIQIFLKELDMEAKTTRKMLSRVPDDKYDWKPHPKSMTIRRLATHVAELPSWITMTLTTSELDFASNPYNPEVINNIAELMNYFERSLADGRARHLLPIAYCPLPIAHCPLLIAYIAHYPLCIRGNFFR